MNQETTTTLGRVWRVVDVIFTLAAIGLLLTVGMAGLGAFCRIVLGCWRIGWEVAGRWTLGA